MTDFEWIVLALGLLLFNIAWWEIYYESHMTTSTNIKKGDRV